jgi:MoaA/NifB/PqqE/SkfB family radical SAM enzyme
MGNQFKAIKQKKMVFLHGIWHPGKLWNLFKLIMKYYLRMEFLKTYPILVKVDVTPICQLKCPVCIHGADSEEAQKQDFKNKEMDFELFRKLTDELAGKTLAFSMYHLGEPLLNKEIYRMIAYASSKGINCYFTSNFSMKITDKEMELMVQSGLRQITVALDGYTQENYSKTRVNGNVELVKNNLERVVSTKKRLGIRDLWITVQTCVFDHNSHEMSQVEEFCERIGVDDHRIFPGTNEPGGWVKVMMPRRSPKKAKAIPMCRWPHFASVVLYNGDVIPCCQYRNDNAYSVEEETIKMGSVANGSFSEVFNGSEYVLARRMMLDPTLPGENVKKNFCYQCPVIYD